MINQYTHLPIGEPVEFLSASYWVVEEDKILYKGEEVLIIVRETSSIISCCGGGCSPGFTSVLIPGFIKKFKYTKGADGLSISDVEPIEDEETMEAIKKIVLGKYPSSQVEFFCP